MPDSAPETAPRIPPGIGVVEHAGRIIVYQAAGASIEWARPLGEPEIEITPELRAVIEADRERER